MTLLSRAPVKFAALTFLTFAVLAARFSPNWLEFSRVVAAAHAELPGEKHDAAIDRAVYSANSERGLWVMRQAESLNTEISEPSHKIIRWRLLVPALGHYLHLPRWVVLGFAHLGCLGMVAGLIALGARGAGDRRALIDGVSLAVVGCASAPFFAAMGWLGYYDSLLVLGLLALAFAPSRACVVAACLLTPWVDERFVMGAPLAIWVRWLASGEDRAALRRWLQHEALFPALSLAVYVAIRLFLGGSGGSQTVMGYLKDFVFGVPLSIRQRLWGAWAGLEVGWLLVAFAVAAQFSQRRQGEGSLLAFAVVSTALAGLFTALDLARSMVLVLPVVPLGWRYVQARAWWARFHVGPALAAAALLIPAWHVYSVVAFPVDRVWSPSRPVLIAQNNIGVLYIEGWSGVQDDAKAMKWFQPPARHGHVDSLFNVGAMYMNKEYAGHDPAKAVEWLSRAADRGYVRAAYALGTIYRTGQAGTVDMVKAAKHYQFAAEHGHADAQNNLGVFYANGLGVPKNQAQAATWYRKAAEQHHAVAERNLGAMYLNGDGVPQDYVEAAKWLKRSAEQGNVEAANNVGVLYYEGKGLPNNPVAAGAWFRIAAALGSDVAAGNVQSLDARLTPQQIAEAQKAAREAMDKWNTTKVTTH